MADAARYDEAKQRLVAVAEVFGLSLERIIVHVLAGVAQLRTEQAYQPRYLHPEHEQRQSGKRTVDGVVAAHPNLRVDVEELQTLHGYTGENAGHNGATHLHLCVGHEEVERNEHARHDGVGHELQEELRQQVPVIKEMLKAMQVPLMMLEGYEADDLLGTVAKKAEADGLEAVVVSGDRDLLQLATDHIMIRIPKTKKGGTEIEDYHTADVIEKYQVTPIQIIELKALMGDSSDNIPGIPGVGEKTATKLIAEYGCIENAYAHVNEIKPNKARESLRDHYDMAQMSKELATINIHSPFELDMVKARMTDLYTKEAFELCKKLEFKNMLSRFEMSQEKQNHTAESFHMTSDLTQAQEWLEKLKTEQQIGFFLLADEQHEFRGLAVSGKEETFFFCNQGFLTEQYLTSALEELIETAEQAVTLQLKRQLRFLQLSESAKKKILDGAISAYLLNPLKGEYPYEDLA